MKVLFLNLNLFQCSPFLTPYVTFCAERRFSLKEIRRRRSGRRRFSSLSLWFRLFMLRRLLWCGRRHRVSSNHLWRAESARRERSGCTFYVRMYVRPVCPCRQLPLSGTVMLYALLAGCADLIFHNIKVNFAESWKSGLCTLFQLRLLDYCASHRLESLDSVCLLSKPASRRAE